MPVGAQGEVQPGEQLLQKALEVWKGPAMIITGDDDPTIPLQVRVTLCESILHTFTLKGFHKYSEVFSCASTAFAGVTLDLFQVPVCSPRYAGCLRRKSWQSIPFPIYRAEINNLSPHRCTGNDSNRAIL